MYDISPVLNRIRGISLKWKLLVPFLFFAFAGTTTLTFIGLSSQHDLIKKEERKEILRYYQQFMKEIKQRETQALSLATTIAENPQVQRLLAERNRNGLRDLLVYTYVRLKMDYNVDQFHFHVPPATSLLRLHSLTEFGDDMRAYRKTIMDAIATGKAVAGLERGATGLGIRGVVPVYHYAEVVGSVEIGHGFGEDFLQDFHESWGVDMALYAWKGAFELLASVGREPRGPLAGRSRLAAPPDAPQILIAPEDHPEKSILLGPVRDYSGAVVALVEIVVDRSGIQGKLDRIRNLMVTVGLTGIVVSFLLTYLVAMLFIRPIKEIVKEAQEIAEEKRESRLEERPDDEIGSLTKALNTMLEALKRRRMVIEEYARTLERRVEERTSDLVASEEKYRALVENVPLIVYRVLRDGTTEFINTYLTDSLGYTIEEAVGDRGFWPEKIWGAGLYGWDDLREICFDRGEEWRVERPVRDRDGRSLAFIDHAIPAVGAGGRVKWVDGIMMDISELKGLQERALRAEEIRILGEISAHMAHEIRNPLSSAGGFARRLRDALPEEDQNRRLAQIIVEEVARLESFLKTLLSSIRPFDLSLSDVNVNDLLDYWLEKLEGTLKAKRIEVFRKLAGDLPTIRADEERLSHCLENLLKHAIISTPDGEGLAVSTSREGDRLVVLLRHRVSRLSEDDLEKFFFPHIEDEAEWALLDLPLSKIIIHRHGGKVDLIREGESILILRIELPITL
ncbi:MAG: HAMP domain-containing protein [Deltaproteobacteria bacterium]|nr:HAMP domain-containing protein [Deltaproteobacteria bacterium]